MSSLNATSAPLISIALCVYNGERYLAEQMASLRAQTWPNLELVIVDDASTDGSVNLIEAMLAKELARFQVTWVRNPQNCGVNASFSKALSLCKGELIAPCDQDDIWSPDKLSRLAGALGGNDMAYCDSELIDSQGKRMGLKVSDRLRMYSGNDPTPFAFWNCASGHAMLFRRELLKQALPLPHSRFHDWWLSFVAASNHGIVYVDQALVQYRQHERSQTDIARTGNKGKKPKADARAVFWERSAWLDRLAGIASPHQPYFQELARLWRARSQQWLSPALVRHLAQRSAALMYTNKRASFFGFALKQCWGLKTKLLFSPQTHKPH